MCELFAASSLTPATLRVTFDEFASHGGRKGPHRDGWGIAWYEDGDLRWMKNAHAASDDPHLAFLHEHPVRSSLLLSHIRKATQGAVATRNCQPFAREWMGRWHAFAHNGDLKGIASLGTLERSNFHPVGETDSEMAFCHLMERMKPLWEGRVPPPLGKRLEAVAAMAQELRAMGPANFLYSDGDMLFAHSHRRMQADGSIHPPGLWQLSRVCKGTGELCGEGIRIDTGSQGQQMQLVASVPLSNETWTPVPEGAVLAIRHGQITGTA